MIRRSLLGSFIMPSGVDADFGCCSYWKIRCSSGAESSQLDFGPRVALRFTRGYSPWPRWGLIAFQRYWQVNGLGCFDGRGIRNG